MWPSLAAPNIAENNPLCSARSPSFAPLPGSASTQAGWVIQPSPNPDGASGSVLSAVACVSDGTCMAVGDFAANGRGLLPLAERWDGSIWTILTTPGASESLLQGVSCPDP